MSIQSNINNTIGQAAILASLNPNIQELGETAKDKSKLKSVEKQLDTLTEKEKARGYDPKEHDNPAFEYEHDAARYNQLRAAHEELAGKLAGKGINVDSFYPEATTAKAIRLERVAEIKANIQRAREQRQRGEALKQQKIAEEEAQKAFRSKQIRDLIMNPNLEVNNGTNNDTRR